MLKIGIVGVGHLGKIHLKLLSESTDYKLVGFYDTDPIQAKKVATETGCKYFNSLESLLSCVDVLDIVSPTTSHYNYAIKALEANKHIFIEKPISSTLEEAEKITHLAKEKNLKGQVGHVERFNPAFLASRAKINSPMFIEGHRLAIFNPRGTDVSVVLDLMIHDLDIVLHTVKSEIKDIQASGVNVISNSPDIANARIVFKNGAVANLTASRISMKNMRKIRFFQKDAYLSIDFLEKSYDQVFIEDADESTEGMMIENLEGVKKRIHFEKPEVTTNNAILQELEAFAYAINHDKEPAVSLRDGTKALEVAQQIISIIEPINT